jgi:hypothetical protein
MKEGPPARIEIVKTTFNIPLFMLNAVKRLAIRRSFPVSQIFRQAMNTDRVLQDFHDRGAKFLTQEPDGQFLEIEFPHLSTPPKEQAK